MAVGSHHGGGFHTGSHHSGGGFSGGGFSGGGFHSGGGSSGGGFSGGGHSGGGFSGGGHYYHGDYGDSNLGLYLRVATPLIYLIAFFIIKIVKGDVPGVNLLSLVITIVSYVIFFFSLKNYDRTFALMKVRAGDRYIYGQVWKGATPPQKSKNGNNRSWADKYGFYRIAFFDQDYGPDNAKTVYEMMKRTPAILWMNLFVWLIIAIVATASTLFFYETFIQIFENMIMTDEAFALIDEIIFYTPSCVTLICAIASVVVVKVRDVLLYRCAEGIVKDNWAADRRNKTEEEIKAELSRKWYYNICPNCGSAAPLSLRSCTSCGSSLEVKDFTPGCESSAHQIPPAKDNKKEEEKT